MNALHPIKSKRRSIGTQHDITFHSKILKNLLNKVQKKIFPPLKFAKAPTSELA
jgi:hypothetical protein